MLHSSPLDKALARLAAAPVSSPVPVLVLSGFLGAGKTTLLRRLLTTTSGLRVGILVNDMADINVDALLLGPSPAAAAAAVSSERMVALTNGCICCTLRDDLLDEVSAMVARGALDYIVIESTGISEPMPVAATFTAPGASGSSLAQYAPLDSMLTVVDAASLLDELASPDLLAARNMAAHAADGRAVASLMAQQIECADTVVLNKCDLVTGDQATHAEAVIAALNPRARIMRAVRCDVPVTQLLHTQRFDAAAAEASSSAGRDAWAEERAAAAQGRPAADHVPESQACGITSTSFTAVRPFHPQRLWDVVVSGGATALLLRSKGLFWLASRPGIAWLWSTVGPRVAEFGPAAQWRADAVPRDMWPQDEPGWDAQWGDRKQQLVLIGTGDALEAVRAQLNQCLLTDDEMRGGDEAWEAGYAEVHAATWGTTELTPEEAAAAAAGTASAGDEHIRHTHGPAHGEEGGSHRLA
jgi:G3E family GTPase